MSRPVKRILIVDDHDVVRRGVRTLVETKPYFNVVGEADDGFQAIEVASRTNPDIAVVDFALPGRNGLTVARMLAEIVPDIEVLIFTSFDQEELLVEGFRLGVAGFVLKSESEHSLLDALEAASVHRRYLSPRTPEKLLSRFLENKPPASGSSLTRREREIAQLVAEGWLNKQIANFLSISMKTVECHRSAIMRKLNLRTTADLVRYAIRNLLITA